MSEKKVNKLAAEDDDFKRVHRSNLEERLSFLKTDARTNGGEPPNQKPESYTGFPKKGAPRSPSRHDPGSSTFRSLLCRRRG